MRWLLDTNIVVRFVNETDPQHALIVETVVRLLERRDIVHVVPQCLYEFWAVATRPTSVNGLALSAQAAAHKMHRLLGSVQLLPETPAFFSTWLDLVTTHQVSGRPTHDARLAAALKVHKLDALLTLNPDDFKRFGLNVLTPADI